MSVIVEESWLADCLLVVVVGWCTFCFNIGVDDWLVGRVFKFFKIGSDVWWSVFILMSMEIPGCLVECFYFNIDGDGWLVECIFSIGGDNTAVLCVLLECIHYITV